jgi:hypothetical protein
MEKTQQGSNSIRLHNLLEMFHRARQERQEAKKGKGGGMVTP